MKTEFHSQVLEKMLDIFSDDYFRNLNACGQTLSLIRSAIWYWVCAKTKLILRNDLLTYFLIYF